MRKESLEIQHLQCISQARETDEKGKKNYLTSLTKWRGQQIQLKQREGKSARSCGRCILYKSNQTTAMHFPYHKKLFLYLFYLFYLLFVSTSNRLKNQHKYFF